MKYLVPVLLICTLNFCGCFTIFQTFRFHSDGSISVGRDIAFDQMFFSLFENMKNALPDSLKSKGLSFNLQDSLRTLFHADSAKLASLPGFVALKEYDTIIDDQHHYIAEARYTDTASLSKAPKFLFPDSSKTKHGSAATDNPFSKTMGSGKDDMKLRLHRTPGKTTIDISLGMTDKAIKDRDKELNKKMKNKTQMEMGINMMKKAVFGYRIYAENIITGLDDHTEQIEGGQEWKLSFEELLTQKKAKTFKHQFIIKE